MMKIYEILKNYYDRNRDNDKLWGSIEELSEMFVKKPKRKKKRRTSGEEAPKE